MQKRILVVDDDSMNLMRTKMILGKDYDVFLSSSGIEALDTMKREEMDLVLLDIEMPEMNGPAVLEELRKDPYLATIPVVFLTGINDVEKIKNALALKPQGYLLKPVEKEALIAKIRELIQ